MRLRKGQANTQRGVLRFLEELLPGVRRAGADGSILLRADSGFWNRKVIAYLRKQGPCFSIGVRMQEQVTRQIAGIPEDAWQPIEDYPDSGICALPVRALQRQQRLDGDRVPCAQLNRWTAIIGLKDPTPRAARTLHRRLFTLPHASPAPPGD